MLESKLKTRGTLVKVWQEQTAKLTHLIRKTVGYFFDVFHIVVFFT